MYNAYQPYGLHKVLKQSLFEPICNFVQQILATPDIEASNSLYGRYPEDDLLSNLGPATIASTTPSAPNIEGRRIPQHTLHTPEVCTQQGLHTSPTTCCLPLDHLSQHITEHVSHTHHRNNEILPPSMPPSPPPFLPTFPSSSSFKPFHSTSPLLSLPRSFYIVPLQPSPLPSTSNHLRLKGVSSCNPVCFLISATTSLTDRVGLSWKRHSFLREKGRREERGSGKRRMNEVCVCGGGCRGVMCVD